MATITTVEARTISSLQRPAGRLALAECLQWEAFDEEKDMQRSIHLDFLYDNIMFAVDKGFSWNKVVTIFEFTVELLQQIKDCDSITDVLGFYRVKSTDLCETLGDREYKIFTNYVFNTILAHYKLIKLVFTTARKEQTPKVPLSVQPPFDPRVLKQSKGINIWEYERQISALEKKEEQRANERLVEKGKKNTEMEAKTQEALNSVITKEQPLDKDSVMSIIEDIMKAYSLAATENMKANISQLQEDLEFKLEKTSVPRPQALGPPPRYNVTAGLKAKTPSARGKSPKPGSRASGRARKK